MLAAGLVDGVRADTVLSLLAASLLLGVLNAVLRPVLLLLALPLLLVTLGLFTFVINALLLYLVGNLVKGFHVEGFWVALKASVLISIVSTIANALFIRNEPSPPSGTRRSSPAQTSRPPPDTGSGPVIDV